MFEGMRYEEYLEKWEKLFGGEEHGVFTYINYGEEIPHVVTKLTKDEYLNVRQKLNNRRMARYIAEEMKEISAMTKCTDEIIVLEPEILVES